MVNLYNYLSGLMQISTSGNFLNFGHWDNSTKNPLDSQKNLCNIVGKMAELDDAGYILDVGSGFSEPSFLWKKNYPNINITCINTNSNQLRSANSQANTEKLHGIDLLNSTAIRIPIADKSCDRIIALESAQHFRPIRDFISETQRILKKDGLAVLAIPILSRRSRMSILKIGILRFTWSSEHYDIETLKKIIKDVGLNLLEAKMIGSSVYLPLADYYIKNRQFLRKEILKRYPAYVEKILFKSMLKMKQAAMDQTIEYVLIKYTK